MSCAQSALCTASLAAQSSDSEPRSSSTRAGMRDSKHIDASGDAKTLVAPHVFCFFILRTFLTRLPFFFGLSKQELRTPTSKQSVRVVPSGQTHQISPPTSRSAMSRLTLMSVARSLPGNEVLVDKSMERRAACDSSTLPRPPRLPLSTLVLGVRLALMCLSWLISPWFNRSSSDRAWMSWSRLYLSGSIVLEAIGNFTKTVRESASDFRESVVAFVGRKRVLCPSCGD